MTTPIAGFAPIPGLKGFFFVANPDSATMNAIAAYLMESRRKIHYLRTTLLPIIASGLLMAACIAIYDDVPLGAIAWPLALLGAWCWFALDYVRNGTILRTFYQGLWAFSLMTLVTLGLLMFIAFFSY
jgi:hypothetical protein